VNKVIRNGFDLNKIYKLGTNRELNEDELILYKKPIHKRSCPICNTGILKRKPVNVGYKILDDNFFIMINITPEGRAEAINIESDYLWGCTSNCSYSELETIKNEKKSKSKIPTL
jgi:hypothetical protein